LEALSESRWVFGFASDFLVLGEKIAEGAHAEIVEAKSGFGGDYVLKVFKERIFHT